MKSKLLLFLLLCGATTTLCAQQDNGVIVSGLTIGADKRITFKLEWERDKMPQPPLIWRDTVWVFVDYNNNGKMTRLSLAPGATSSAGAVVEVDGNDQGVWIVGTARTTGQFSTTVTLIPKNSEINVAGACAYASNYPPVGQYLSATEMAFTGTPPYNITLDNGITYTSGSPFPIPVGNTAASLTDATGAPGIFNCISPSATYTLAASDACLGTEVALNLSGSQSGWQYQLYKGNTAVGSAKQGTGSVLAFSDTPATAGNFDYLVRTVDPTNVQCEMQVSEERGITVNPLPTNLELASGSTTICDGQPVTLTASASGAASYSLNGSDWQTGTNFNVAPNSSTSYTLYAMTTEGCLNTKTDAAAVAVNSLPANPSVTPNERCDAGTVALNATSSGAAIDWYTMASDGTFLLTGNSYTTPSLSTSTTYYAEARNTTTGCLSANRMPVLATVYPLPIITGQPAAYLLVDLNNPFSLSVTAQPGGGTTLGYQWRRNGSNVTNGSAATYSAAGTVNAGGTYNVVVSNAYTCSVTSSNTKVDVQDLPPIAECRDFETGKIGSSATGSCTGFDAGAVGISLVCYQFDAGCVGK
jgi:hypothetical protein